jgi:D-amino-acid dehydrogenase
MKVIVIGCGLIGITTAYCLQARGHRVTVIERREGPGREASFANGALLTPGMSEPWNAPGCWRVLLRSLIRHDSPLQLNASQIPALARWGVKFLRESSRLDFERNTLSNLRLSRYSLKVMEFLRQRSRIDYAHSTRGSLKLFRDQFKLQEAWERLCRIMPADFAVRRLTRAEAVATEPALGAIAPLLAGAVYYPGDETGDAYRFCLRLTQACKIMGVNFRFAAGVSHIESRKGQVTAVISATDRFVADRYVMAAGSRSAMLLRGVRIRLPVAPAKGYSVTFGPLRGDVRLSVPLIDDELHVALVPFGNGVRVAGMAQFAGFDERIDVARANNLSRLAGEMLPRAKIAAESGQLWCGLRPMSADGVPIIGATKLANLFVNTGHGHLGWTMAAGSARLLSDILSGDAPAIDATPFALSRFG